MNVTTETRRHSAGAARVKVDGKQVGWARKFGLGDWRVKPLDADDYPSTGWATLRAAGEALAKELA